MTSILLLLQTRTVVTARFLSDRFDPADMRNQIALSLDNLEAVPSAADMGLADITKLRIHTIDVDEAMRNFDLLGLRFGPLAAAPPMTLPGVTRLARPELLFEIEASAAS